MAEAVYVFGPESVRGAVAEPPMAVRSAVTVKETLVGFWPGCTTALIVVVEPVQMPDGAAPVPVNRIVGLHEVTISEMDELPTRLSASVMVTGRLKVPAPTLARDVVNVQVFVGDWVKTSAAVSAMACMSAVTLVTSEVGLAPEDVTTVNVTVVIGQTVPGEALPVPVGGVLLGQAEIVVELRGEGACTKKSLALLSVSWQPPFLRKAAVVVVSAAPVTAVSEQLGVVP